MAEVVRALPDERRIAGEGWSLRADRLELTGSGWRALIGVRRGLILLVTCTGLAAIEGPDQNASVARGSYLHSPGSGGVFPLHPEDRRRP